ncbi:hypothetical protein Taro_007185 [Colocasia esculenta]|uniref:Trimethylguanosine synthase n=1 Tax=Colocasia esculenta TaxID=4460 RepID=A0A843TY70_COLES|nr:hypothetical protein [Colocasia esculenta]
MLFVWSSGLFVGCSYSEGLWREIVRRTGRTMTLCGDVTSLFHDWHKHWLLKTDKIVWWLILHTTLWAVREECNYCIFRREYRSEETLGDVVFLSPPWGGPDYRTIRKFTLDFLKPEDGYACFFSPLGNNCSEPHTFLIGCIIIAHVHIIQYSIFQLAQRISPNIIMFLPRNVDRNQLEELSWLSSPPLNVEVIIDI